MGGPGFVKSELCCQQVPSVESTALPDAMAPAETSALRDVANAIGLCARRPLQAYAQTTLLAACAAVAAEPLARDLVLWLTGHSGGSGMFRVAAAGFEWFVLLTVLGQLPGLSAALMWPAVRATASSKPVAPAWEIAPRLAAGALTRAFTGLRLPLVFVLLGAALDLAFLGNSYSFWTSVGIGLGTCAWFHSWARHSLSGLITLEEDGEPRAALARSDAFWKSHTLRLESLLLAWPLAAMAGGGAASAWLPGFAMSAVWLGALCLVLPAWGASLAFAYRARRDVRPVRGSVSICRCLLVVMGAITGLGLLQAALFPCCCCGSLAEMQTTKARQDLDTLANAARLYESRFKPLRGNDLNQLLGTVMNEIPADPWGQPYLLDTARGTLTSLGADGAPGGTGLDEDIVARFK